MNELNLFWRISDLCSVKFSGAWRPSSFVKISASTSTNFSRNCEYCQIPEIPLRGPLLSVRGLHLEQPNMGFLNLGILEQFSALFMRLSVDKLCV